MPAFRSGLEQAVDASVRRARLVDALGRADLVARVVGDEGDVGMGGGGGPDIHRVAAQPLVHADDRRADLLDQREERLAQLIVEPPRVPDVGVGLPGGQVVPLRLGAHRVERRLDRAHVRLRMALHEHAPVTAQLVGGATGRVHHLGGEGVGITEHRDGREHDHRGVGALEHEVEPVGRVVARLPVAAGRLRERAAEGALVAVELEEVLLHVDDGLAIAAEDRGGHLRLGGRLRRKVEGARGRRVVIRAGAEGQQGGGRGHRRAEEVAARHPEPPGRLVAGLAGDVQRRGGRRVTAAAARTPRSSTGRA